MLEDPSRILVINVTRIGDTLAATPAIDLLRQHWALSEITVLGAPRPVDLLDNLPCINHIKSFTKRSAFFRGWSAGKWYDLALVYNYDESLVRYALRVARRVVAFRQKSPDINQQLFLSVHPNAYATTHITEHFLRLPAALGLPASTGRIQYRCMPREVEEAKAQLHKLGFVNKGPLVGLQVASFNTKNYRDWPVEYFLVLCQQIQARWPEARFMIYGGTEEKSRTLWLKKQLGALAVHLAGQLSLRETAAVMSLTDLYVGVDTGPTHLMSSFDIPIIGLYHSRHPAKCLAPKDHPLNFSLDHPYSCDDHGAPRPMADIRVERVFAKVEKALTTQGYV